MNVPNSEILSIARAAKAAAREVASVSSEVRTNALNRIGVRLQEAEAELRAANSIDVENGRKKQLPDSLSERLELTDRRFSRMVSLVNEIANMDDIIGRIDETVHAPNGLVVSKMRIPLGVLMMIYESRPTITSDAAACAIRTGNAVILRGGSEAIETNRAIGSIVSRGLEDAGLPPAVAQVVPWVDRKLIGEFLQLEEEIDLVIPRGNEGLIRYVTEHSRIPVLKHYKGVCHVYVHADADLEMAERIAVNSKTPRPVGCYVAESLLVDSAIVEEFVPRVCRAFKEAGVEVRGDDVFRRLGGADVVPATDDDYRREYLSLIISCKVVDGPSEAMAHIAEFGSDHTESIVTENEDVALDFQRKVNSSTVFWNAPTRFAELPDFGMGPELGTSTSRLHAFGPMGANELTITKFVVKGSGQHKA